MEGGFKVCPACAEHIKQQALKCKHCGELLFSPQWRDFCEAYRQMSQGKRETAWRKLSPEQKNDLQRMLPVFEEHFPDEQFGPSPTTTSNGIAEIR